MTEPVTILTVVALAMLMQLFAAWSALRLPKVGAKQPAWNLIAFGTLALAARNGFILYRIVESGRRELPDATAELTLLAASLILAIGVRTIRPMMLTLRRSMKRMRKDQSIYKDIVESVDDILFLVDSKQAITYWNDAAKSATRIPRNKAIGKPLLKVLPEVKKSSLDLVCREVWSSRKPNTVAIDLELKGDDKLSREVILYPVPNGVAVLIHEMPERAGIARTSIEIENGQPDIFGNAALGIVLLDLVGRIVTANKAFFDMLGMTLDSLADRYFHELSIDQEISEREKNLRKELFDGERSHYPFEKEFRKQSGGKIYCRLTTSLIRRAEGEIEYFLVLIEDITEHHKVLEMLREAEKRYQEMIGKNSLGIWRLEAAEPISTDLNAEEIETKLLPYLELAECNDVMAKMHGIAEAKDIIGMTLPEIMKHGKPERFNYLRDFVRAQFRLVNHETMFKEVKKDEEEIRYCLVNQIGIVRNNMLHRVWGIQVDLTEHHMLQEDKAFTDERMVRSQRLESVSELAGKLAHDYNNLLGGIMAKVGIAMMEMDEDSPAAKQLLEIEELAAKMSGLTDQISDFSGRKKHWKRPLNLNHLLHDMTQMIETAIGKRAFIDYLLAKNLPNYSGDVNMLRQAMMNLINNAIEAVGKDQSTIKIATGVFKATRQYLDSAHLGDQIPDGQYMFMEVLDHGPGISEDLHDRIFDPFFTTKGEAQGLGLAAVHGIMKAHDGAIHVKSKPGKGAAFRLLFPMPISTPVVIHEEKEIEDGKAVGKPHITGTLLIAEDEEIMRTAAKTYLESAGFTVLTASDGVEALELFAKHVDDIGAVILDMTMPKMGGADVYREMQYLAPETKVIFVSGYRKEEVMMQAGIEGYSNFLRKPYNLQTLLRKVISVLSADEASDK